MLWSEWTLPVKIPEGDYLIALPLTNPKVQMQPPKKRSLRIKAESFRLIIKHLQTFSRAKFIPAYSKQGRSSLQKLRFTAYHEAGVSRRPVLPNAKATYAFIHDMILMIPHEPPFHTEFPAPMCSENSNPEQWPDWPEMSPSKRDQFTQHIRYALFRKKNLDTIMHPGPN